jgi:hypothetical protein
MSTPNQPTRNDSESRATETITLDHDRLAEATGGNLDGHWIDKKTGRALDFGSAIVDTPSPNWQWVPSSATSTTNHFHVATQPDPALKKFIESGKW